MKAFLLSTTFAFATLTHTALAADLIFSNSPSFATDWSSRTSCRGDDFSGYRSFDAFQLPIPVPSQVTTVQWIGVYWDSLNPAGNPALPSTRTWELTFYADAEGSVGQLLQSVQLPASDVTIEALFNVNLDGDPAVLRRFTAELPIPLQLSPNTTYWFSPLSIQTAFNPVFSWWFADNGGTCVQISYDPPATNIVSHNRAFSLLGQLAAPASSIRFSEVEISWPSLLGVTYRVEYCTNLVSGQWTLLPSANCVEGNGATAAVYEKISLDSTQRYYRVRTGGIDCR